MAEDERSGTSVAGFEQKPTEESRPSRRERRRSYLREHPLVKWALLAVLIAIAVLAIWAWQYYSIRETTDDAQIDGHVNPVSARVSGTVIAVNVDDNQLVHAGDVLVQIDPRDYQVALDRANADLAQAVATSRAAETGIPITKTTTASRLETARAGVGAAQAGITAAQKEVEAARAQLNAEQARLRESEARNTLAQQNLVRFKQLVTRDEISQQQFDGAVSEAAAASAAVDSVRAAVAQAEHGVPVAQSHVAQAQAAYAQAQAAVQAAQTAPHEIASSRAQSGSAEAKVQQNQAALAQAELNMQYTTVKAPIDGVVSRKTVEIGQVVQVGQPMLAVVPLENTWVTANYKETQLRRMRVGQRAIIKVDAYGGHEYEGHVDSIAAATGARFSLLPPENATGNFVKVVQRVPVKIVLERGQDPQHTLRPGLSVDATVITR